MRDKKGVSVALLLLAVAGVTLASRREVAEVPLADEPVCVASESAERAASRVFDFPRAET